MTREEAIKYAEAMKAKVQERIEFFRLGSTHAPEVCYSDLVFLSAAISALREQEERRWIPVTERLPEQTLPPHDVLVYHDLGCGMFVDRAWYNYDRHRWYSVLGTKLKVTHWMPLPEPPKEDAR